MLPSSKEPRTRFILFGVIALVLTFGGGIALGGAVGVPFTGVNAASDVPPEGVDFGPFYQSWRILEENFVPATTTAQSTDQEKVWGAIKGLAESYGDDYTVFFTPVEKEFFESEVRGDFEGVGMEIGIRDGVLTVVTPLKNTPADRAGLQSGDSIIAINGEDTRGLGVEAAVIKIRGERGTPVVFTILRGNEAPFEATVIRDTITLPTLETELKDGDVFIIRLFGFNAIAPQLFRNAVREFAESGTNKLIIDLRGNPGGFLEVAVDMASWFLPVGKTIVIEDHNDESLNIVHRSRGYNVFTDQLKLAILINQGSASASEIFAGALSEYDKATLIGETSFGKGSVQQVFPVTDTTSLKITIARWLTPNGNSISNGGITPDIEVALTAEDREALRDPQLDRAVEFLRTGQ